MPSMRMTVKSRAILCLIFMALSIALLGCKKGGPGLSVSGNDFTLKNVDGSTFNSADLRGKVVLLEFWATWCPPCKMAIPEVQALAEKIKGKNIVIVTVSVDDSYDTVKAFVNDNAIAYTVLHDTNGDVSKKYNIRSVPTTVILDKLGNVVSTHLGYMPDYSSLMLEELQKLL